MGMALKKDKNQENDTPETEEATDKSKIGKASNAMRTTMTSQRRKKPNPMMMTKNTAL